jgi:hypothetical protein
MLDVTGRVDGSPGNLRSRSITPVHSDILRSFEVMLMNNIIIGPNIQQIKKFIGEEEV